METTQPQPFCIIPTGLPPLTVPSSIPNPTSYVYKLPTIRPYNHIVVFLVPGIEIPPNTAAAVYISLPNTPEFKFLGGIGPGKESAIFKISGLVSGSGSGNGIQEVDMDSGTVGATSSMPEITIGISLESAESVSAQMAALTSTNQSSSLVLAPKPQEQTVKLAQKIIKNAFNFLASFSGNTTNGVEVVPLKAFEEWWRKFEGRVVRDPGFLERADGD